MPSAAPGLVRCSSSMVAALAAIASVILAGLIFARPKSSTFAWLREVTKMLAGLMSRWMMPLV